MVYNVTNPTDVPGVRTTEYINQNLLQLQVEIKYKRELDFSKKVYQVMESIPTLKVSLTTSIKVHVLQADPVHKCMDVQQKN